MGCFWRLQNPVDLIVPSYELWISRVRIPGVRVLESEWCPVHLGAAGTVTKLVS